MTCSDFQALIASSRPATVAELAAMDRHFTDCVACQRSPAVVAARQRVARMTLAEKMERRRHYLAARRLIESDPEASGGTSGGTSD